MLPVHPQMYLPHKTVRYISFESCIGIYQTLKSKRIINDYTKVSKNKNCCFFSTKTDVFSSLVLAHFDVNVTKCMTMV